MLRGMFCKIAAIGLLTMFLAGPATAQSGSPPAVQAVNVWARATPQGAKTGAAYMTLVNQGQTDDRLIGVATPVAGEAQIHSMSLENGVMMLRPVPGIDVKAGATAMLKPGDYHVMLMDLKQPLIEGSSFPITLTFEKAGKVQVTAKIAGIGAMDRSLPSPKP